MNVIELMLETIKTFPEISEVTDTVHMEFSEDNPESFGLSSIGDRIVSEDILGNQTREHSFLFYATYSAVNDFERISNSGKLLSLAMWLERKKGAEITAQADGKTLTGFITSVRCENGMLYEIPKENLFNGVQYQMQIVVTYKIQI